MSNSVLFDSCTFTMEVPPEFKLYPNESTAYASDFNTMVTKKSTLHAPILRAILAYIKLSKATTDGISVDGLGAIGTQRGKKIIAEYIGGRKDIQCVVYTKDTGSILASVFPDEKASGAQFVHKASGGKETGTAVFFALIPILLEDEEFKEHYKIYVVWVQNLNFELGGIETDFLESAYFVTSKSAMKEFWGTTFSSEDKDMFWENLQKSAMGFCEYNQINGIKYHLEKSPDDGTDTRIGQYEKLCDAIKDDRLH